MFKVCPYICEIGEARSTEKVNWSRHSQNQKSGGSEAAHDQTHLIHGRHFKSSFKEVNMCKLLTSTCSALPHAHFESTIVNPLPILA